MDVVIHVVMHFADDGSRQFYIDWILELLSFFLHKIEERSWGEVSLHFFELRNQSISQFRRFFIENLPFIFLTYYLYACWLEADIYIFVSFGYFRGFKLTGRFQIAINYRKRSIEVLLLIWDKIHHWIWVFKRFYEDFSKKVNSMCQNSGVAADKNNLLLKYKKGQ